MSSAPRSAARIPLVYVAGKFRAASPWEVEQNIRRAEEVALLVWQAGAAAICPHANTRFFDKAPNCPDAVFLDGDLEILRRCDAIVMVPGWESSKGATAERIVAIEMGLPVFVLWWAARIDEKGAIVGGPGWTLSSELMTWLAAYRAEGAA